MLPFILFPAYAEIHYRFRYFFSLLKKAEPEIIADVPHRLELPNPLPVLVLIKDAHQYPITLEQVDVFVDGQKKLSRIYDMVIQTHWHEVMLTVPLHDLKPGLKAITVKIRYRVKNKEKILFNDNYRTTRKKPLLCYLSQDHLPRAEGFYYGDLHSHSSFTEDQIEFGAGLGAMRSMARACGLQFFAVTDHSYDLDDMPDNYLVNDSQLGKWQNFKHQVARLNRDGSLPIIIPGEELSVGNHKGQNVHLLILNNEKFISGQGDSGERWFHFKPDHNLPELSALVSEQAMLVPAHPAEKTPLLQKLFINRGNWHTADLTLPIFKALQSINGGTEKEIREGIAQWVNLLLQRRRITLLAGNDAHGSFARARQIGIPFFYIRESTAHRFGVWRTGVYLETPPRTPSQILSALKQGNVLVTNGPFINMTIIEPSRVVPMGGASTTPQQVQLHLLSSSEFGSIESVQILGGDLLRGRETVLWQKKYAKDQYFQRNEKITLRLSQEIGYIRSRLITRTQNRQFWGLTNAIYLSPGGKQQTT